jgi:Holliday junction DNA helicase RuvB
MSGNNEINDKAPTSLPELVGQKSILAQVQVALDAARQDGTKFPSALLTGGPGLGKSQLARCIAYEMGTDFIEVLGQSIRDPADLNAVLLSASERAVVHFDEAHELDKEFQVALYLAIDQRKVMLNTRSSRGPQAIPLADFSLLLSTTDEYCLLQPMRDRLLVLRFQFFSEGELVEVLRHRSLALGWQVDDAVFPQIARRSRGTPRLALRLLQACRRVCRAGDESIISLDHLGRACLLEQIDHLGLGPVDQQYLAVLAEGTSRLNVIGSRLGLHSRTVAEVVEPYLIRVGLVVKDDQGRRQLTAEGREHLSQGRPERDPE